VSLNRRNSQPSGSLTQATKRFALECVEDPALWWYTFIQAKKHKTRC